VFPSRSGVSAVFVLLAALMAVVPGRPERSVPAASDGLVSACDAGRLADCVKLAETYADTDWPRALRLYDKACRGGVASACYQMGLVHLLGADGPRDASRAAPLLQQACDGGEASACVELAFAYDAERADAQVLPRDVERADALFASAARLSEKACDGGDPHGCGGLAWLYTMGRGVAARDLPRAARLLQKGCERGDALLCRRLGNVYAQGEGVEKDAAKAVALLQQACTAGVRPACQDVKRLRWAEITQSAASASTRRGAGRGHSR
jgi:TPR repeat protein